MHFLMNYIYKIQGPLTHSQGVPSSPAVSCNFLRSIHTKVLENLFMLGFELV